MKAIFLTFLALILCSSFLFAGEKNEDLPKLFEQISHTVGVPQKVLVAIAKVESGLKPWALNIEGKGYQFASKAEAVAKAREAFNAGRSFDIGLMQINSWWLKRYGLDIADVFDPQANIELGAMILKQELERHGDLWAAVGSYHSPNSTRARRYARKVRAVTEGRNLFAAKFTKRDSLIVEKQNFITMKVNFKNEQ